MLTGCCAWCPAAAACCTQVRFAGLPHYEERHEDFLADAVVLRRRFTPDSECEGRGGGFGVGVSLPRGGLREGERTHPWRWPFGCCLRVQPSATATLCHHAPSHHGLHAWGRLALPVQAMSA